MKVRSRPLSHEKGRDHGEDDLPGAELLQQASLVFGKELGAEAPPNGVSITNSKKNMQFFRARGAHHSGDSASVTSFQDKYPPQGRESEPSQHLVRPHPMDLSVNVNVNLNVNYHKKRYFYNTVVHQPSPESEKPVASGSQQPAAPAQPEYNYQKPIRQTRRHHQHSDSKQPPNSLSPTHPKHVTRGAIHPTLHHFGAAALSPAGMAPTMLQPHRCSTPGKLAEQQIASGLQQHSVPPHTPLLPCPAASSDEAHALCLRCSGEPGMHSAQQQYPKLKDAAQLPPRLSLQACTSPFSRLNQQHPAGTQTPQT